MLLKKSLPVLIGILLLSTLLAFWIKGCNSKDDTPLPPPVIDTPSITPTVPLVEQLREMDTQAADGQGTIAGSEFYTRHNFDNDGNWEVERHDDNQDGFFERVFYDVNDDGQLDYLRADSNHNQQFEADELYRRRGETWMRDQVPIAELETLDDRVMTKQGHIEQVAGQIRYDLDNDGQTDVIERDTDGDGQIDSREYDIDGDGVPSYRRIDVNHDGVLAQDELYVYFGGLWWTAFAVEPSVYVGDLPALLQTLENQVDKLKGLPPEAVQEESISLQDGTQTTMLKYDLDGDERFEIATLDMDGDETFETMLFDLSKDGQAEYAWRDVNGDSILEEIEISEYEQGQGWAALIPEIFPFPMPFPSLYLP